MLLEAQFGLPMNRTTPGHDLLMERAARDNISSDGSCSSRRICSLMFASQPPRPVPGLDVLWARVVSHDRALLSLLLATGP